MLKSASGAAHGVVTPRPLAPRHGTKGDGANVGGGPAAPGRFGVTVPEGLKALVQECWAPDFEARPDFHVGSKVPPSPPFPPPPRPPPIPAPLPADAPAGPALVRGQSCVCTCGAAATLTLSCSHWGGHEEELNQKSDLLSTSQM